MEIPLREKYRNHSGTGRKGKGSGNSGSSRPRLPVAKGEKEAAMAATRANQRVLVLEDGCHRRMRRLSGLEA